MDRNELVHRFFMSVAAMARMASMQRPAQPNDMPTRAQAGVLFAIDHGGPQSVKALSQQFGMTSSAVTQVVNGLVDGGLIVRKSDPHDRRQISLALTAKGKKALARAKAYRINRMREALSSLSDDEMVQLLKIQEKIVEHLKTVCKTTRST